jgi:protein pelota
VLRQYGIEEISTVRQGAGKMEGGSQTEFFEEAYRQLINTGAQNYIVAGPGFIKEDFIYFATQKDKDFAQKIVVENVMSVGISGFQEVLRRGALDRLVKDAHIAKEACLIEELFKEIATDGKAAYGWDEVKKAEEWGAIDILLIADETLRHERERGFDIDQILMRVDKSDGHVVVFSTEFEPGQRLEKLGGIAALLRFKIESG